ncbi:MAG: hypothetical protein QOD25_1999, partial [Alphaproteobacteria bacterium]|nr:hypothetical protein [Alphaproteobacteria bacterium]
MSEPENFIARWSRRKREAADEAETTKPAAASGVSDQTAHADGAEEAGGVPPARTGASEPASEFDWTKLPPVETITAESDIRAFLRA